MSFYASLGDTNLTKYKSYCGCCGNTCSQSDWCNRCLDHVKPQRKLALLSFCGYYLPDWERTFYAQHERNCPYAYDRTLREICEDEKRNILK